MKKTNISFICIVMSLCMIICSCPLVAYATTNSIAPLSAENGAKAYDTANNGDVLYTVNFNYDNTFVTNKSGNAGTVSITDTDKGTGAKLTLSNKTANAAYYGGNLTSYPITNHVYTISYYIENTNTKNIRIGAQFINVNGTANSSLKFRMGINTAKEDISDGKLMNMHLVENGSVTRTLTSVERLVDVTKNNRQYFKAVIDGVNNCVAFYTLGVNESYELLHRYKIMSLNYDYLSIGLYTYDSITETDSISIGDVEIAKGSFVENDYRNRYDNAEYGDTLYDVDFEKLIAGKDGWSYMLNNTGVPGSTQNSLTLNNESATAQYVAVYHPDMNAHNYGSYTYEFYVDSDNRTGLSVLGAYTAGGSFYATGFSYFNSGANMFTKVNGWTNSEDTALSAAPYNCSVTVYSQQQSPKTGTDIACNVKIEFDTTAKTVTNYILTEKGFTKTASIDYSNSPLSPVLYFYAYNGNTNATFSNLKIRKGLTVAFTDSVDMVDMQVGTVTDGKQTVRFVACGSSTAFNRAGLKIVATFDGGRYEYDYSTHEVCKKLTSPTQDTSISAISISEGDEFLFGYTLSGIPADIKVTFTVTPYVIDKYGDTSYGESLEYLLINGAKGLDQ